MENDVNYLTKLRLSDDYHYLRLKLAEELLLPKAQIGELWAIQSLLKLAAEALADGARLNLNVATFISEALIKIYDGEKADDAFGIARKPGEKNTRRARQRSFSMAFFIEKTCKQENVTLDNALSQAADKYHASYDTAKKAWKDNYKEARRILQLHENNFG